MKAQSREQQKEDFQLRTRSIRLSSICGLLVAAALPLAADGPVFTVTTTADGGGSCDAGSTTCTLRLAVQQANAAGAASTVVVPAGTYLLSQSTVCATRAG